MFWFDLKASEEHFYPSILTVFLPKCIKKKCCEAQCDLIVTTTVDIEYIATSWSNKCKLIFTMLHVTEHPGNLFLMSGEI